MFVTVRPLAGYHEALWYHVPPQWQQVIFIGAIVQVPLQKRQIRGYVIHEQNEQPSLAGIKDIIAVESLPADDQYMNFMQDLAHYNQIDIRSLLNRMGRFFTETKRQQACAKSSTIHTTQEVVSELTVEQQQASDSMCQKVIDGHYAPMVLHGVTGSGKTELYKRVIQTVYDKGKTTLLLLPEINMVLDFERRLAAQLSPSMTIHGIHTATTIQQRRALWRDLLEEKSLLIIGVHMPVLLPIANLGAIIIDEEHDAGYQEKRHPKINSKQAALMRAHRYSVPIILGSATPSIASLYNVQKRGWIFLQLKKRFAGSFAKVRVVPLIARQRRESFWITNELHDAISNCLARREQIILFINRRGYSFFMQCAACGFVARCLRCSVSLVVHAGGFLRCHYCDYQKPLPTSCPTCQSSEILKKGIGTQQVADIVSQLFPQACVKRVDLDISSKRNEWRAIIRDFAQGQVDILVGTQSITKGYDFQRVSLVGIIWADVNVHMPLYNATEVALQQLIQVGGRAGRQGLQSQVIVQTMADQPFYAHLNEVDYLDFAHDELEVRKICNYPPYIRLVEIELKHNDEELINREANFLANQLRIAIAKEEKIVELLGPSSPPVAKIKRMHMRKIYIKAASFDVLVRVYQQALLSNNWKSGIFFVPNPVI